MKRFAALFTALDATASTLAKVQAMQRYFEAAPAADAAWAVYFLAGGKPRQVLKVSTLRAAALRVTGLPDWLFDACYQSAGDLAETIAHVLPAAHEESHIGLAEWVEQRLMTLRGLPDAEAARRVEAYWRELDPQGRFLLIKLVGGGFRVGVSRLLVQRALAAHGGLDPKLVAQRMMAYTSALHRPTAAAYAALSAAPDAGDSPANSGQPYPFFLAHALDLDLCMDPPEGTTSNAAGASGSGDNAQLLAAHMTRRLGPPQDWQVEWKYDGIRGQLVRRAGQTWLWSRGEELVTERFPEIAALAQTLPDGTVLDGEILVWRHESSLPASADMAGESAGRPAPFALLQQRITRKTLPKKLLAEAPVIFLAYDLLEWQGRDLRSASQRERRATLQTALAGGCIRISPLERLQTWGQYIELRRQSRQRGVEGFMLKRLDAAYGVGRSKAEGLWWKWKIDSLTLDCVLIYAQAGHGRRATLYTDYTFAVWSRPPLDAAEAEAAISTPAPRVQAAAGGGAAAANEPLQLVAFAKAYSGLTDLEFKQIDAVIRKTTLEKFGPVRSVRPSLVFELGFEGVSPSPRHKSGVAVRFPRMLRIRADKPLHEAGSLQDLQVLMRLNDKPRGSAAGRFDL
jgi:DNA ligase-1